MKHCTVEILYTHIEHREMIWLVVNARYIIPLFFFVGEYVHKPGDCDPLQ